MAGKQAVKTGRIKPQTYSLAKIATYVFTSPKLSVMEKLPGVGFDSLFLLLEMRSLGRNILAESKLQKETRAFAKVHPEITRERLWALKAELRKNLSMLSQGKANFSFDISGTNNILILGANKKTGKMKIALVDQIYPGDEPGVRRRLKEQGQKKK